MPLFIETTDVPEIPDSRYTVRGLVEEVLGELSGYTLDVGQVTYLTQDVDEYSTSFRVDNPSQMGSGLAEVGDELIRVARRTNNGFEAAPNGRGYRSSRVRAWSSGTEVTFGPRFPRASILTGINDTITNAYPDIWGIGQTEFQVSGVKTAYELPAEAEEVLGVDWRPITPTEQWRRIDRYRFDPVAPTEFSSGKVLYLPAMQPGRTVRVRYKVVPQRVEGEDTFTASGLAATAWPVVKYGTLHRLAAPLSLGTLDKDSAQAAEFNRFGKKAPAVEVSERYYVLYMQSLAQERERLLKANPARASYRRS